MVLSLNSIPNNIRLLIVLFIFVLIILYVLYYNGENNYKIETLKDYDNLLNIETFNSETNNNNAEKTVTELQKIMDILRELDIDKEKAQYYSNIILNITNKHEKMELLKNITVTKDMRLLDKYLLKYQSLALN